MDLLLHTLRGSDRISGLLFFQGIHAAAQSLKFFQHCSAFFAFCHLRQHFLSSRAACLFQRIIHRMVLRCSHSRRCCWRSGRLLCSRYRSGSAILFRHARLLRCSRLRNHPLRLRSRLCSIRLLTAVTCRLYSCMSCSIFVRLTSPKH